MLPRPFRVPERYRLVINVNESAHPLTTTEGLQTKMAIFSRNTVQADPLDTAVTKGRNVRGLLSSYVSDLLESNELHDAVIETEQSVVRNAQGRIEIAQREKDMNLTLANNLKSALGVGE